MNLQHDKPQRAAFRYYGGKWKLADWVISHFPPHSFYVEPFGGGASVLLKKPACKSEIYNDLDSEVVNYFRVLRDPSSASKLRQALELTPFARDEYAAAYLSGPEDDDVEKARKFFIKTMMGWGTRGSSGQKAFRTHRGVDGEGVVATDFVNYPKHIPSFTARLRTVVIENRPADEVIKLHDGQKVLFYCDPPYLPETRTAGTGQYNFEMTVDDHMKLAGLLLSLKGFVVLSGYPSDLYLETYGRAGWKMTTRIHHTEKAVKRTECLWLSPRTAEALNHKNLFGEM